MLLSSLRLHNRVLKIVSRTVSGGGQVGDDGEPHEVRQAEVRHDAVAAAGAEGPVPRAVVPVEVRHVLHHRHAGDLRAVPILYVQPLMESRVRCIRFITEEPAQCCQAMAATHVESTAKFLEMQFEIHAPDLRLWCADRPQACHPGDTRTLRRANMRMPLATSMTAALKPTVCAWQDVLVRGFQKAICLR